MALSSPPARVPPIHFVKKGLTFALAVISVVMTALSLTGESALYVTVSWTLHSCCWVMCGVLLVMEYQRFLPQSWLGLRGFWLYAGLEAAARLVRMQLVRVAPTFLVLFVLLEIALCILSVGHPEDLPVELLPYIARLVTSHNAQTGREVWWEDQAHLPSTNVDTANSDHRSKMAADPSAEQAPAARGRSFQRIRVEISNIVLRESERRTHAEYKIIVKWRQMCFNVRRRYNEFYRLDKTLRRTFPPAVFPELSAQLPTLPPKDVITQNQLSPDYLDGRRRGLESYLQLLVSNPAFWRPPLLSFLFLPHDPDLLAQNTEAVDRYKAGLFLDMGDLLASEEDEYSPLGGGKPLGGTRVQGDVSEDNRQSSPPEPAERIGIVGPSNDTDEGIPSSPSLVVRVAIPHFELTANQGERPFVVYHVTWDAIYQSGSVRRRYREFLNLYDVMRRRLCIRLPKLPGKMPTARKDYFFHEHRRSLLQDWIVQVVRDPACLQSAELWEFLRSGVSRTVTSLSVEGTSVGPEYGKDATPSFSSATDHDMMTMTPSVASPTTGGTPQGISEQPSHSPTFLKKLGAETAGDDGGNAGNVSASKLLESTVRSEHHLAPDSPTSRRLVTAEGGQSATAAPVWTVVMGSGEEVYPKYKVTIPLSTSDDKDTLFTLEVVKSVNRTTTRWRVLRSWTQFQELHHSLCKTFWVRGICLVPDFPSRGFPIISSNSQWLETRLETYMRALMRNYQTFHCAALDSFIEGDIEPTS